MEMSDLTLPAAGLAEDILARFMSVAQEKTDMSLGEADKTTAAVSYHLVTFRLGREEYGVEIGSVQEIIRATDITPVPGVQAHVRGVINLRGKIVPVIDLRKRFGLPESAVSDLQRIMVVELDEKRLGMLVDSVSQVIRIPAAVVEDIPEEATTIDDDYVKGIGKLDNRLVIMLDLNRSLLNITATKSV